VKRKSLAGDGLSPARPRGDLHGGGKQPYPAIAATKVPAERRAANSRQPHEGPRERRDIRLRCATA